MFIITTKKKIQIKGISVMKYYDQSVKINHNWNYPYMPDHPCRTFIIGGSGSGRTYVLLNIIKHQRPDIKQIFYTSKIHLNQSINCDLIEEKN